MRNRQQQQPRARAVAAARARRGPTGENASKTRQIAAMINDPCMGPTVAPEYGGSQNGYVSRFKKTLGIGGVGATCTSGYLIWYPDFQGGNNLLSYNSVHPDTNPTNSAVNPLGFSANESGSSGGFKEDPVKPWVGSAAVEDGRLAAACMRLTYTGAMSALRGRFASISGISRDQLLHGGYEGGALSPNELLNLASNAERFSTSGAEIRARPGEPSQYYRTAGGPDNATYSYVADNNKDNCFNSEMGTGTYEPATGPSAGNGIALVWTGVDPLEALVIELFKVLEWRPKAVSGIVQKHSQSTGENLSAQAVGLLDKVDYMWQSAVGAYGVSQKIGGMISNIANSGMVPRALGGRLLIKNGR